MSYIRITKKSDGNLPTVPSEEDVAVTPIEVTAWKCRRQILGTLVLCLGFFSVGTVFGWAAVAVPPLKIERKIYPGEGSEAAAASLFIIGALFAGPVAGYVMYKLGRQIGTFAFAVLLSIGWAFIPMANFIDNTGGSEALIFVGRFVTGFAGAGCLIIGPVYVREISDDGVRTALSSTVPMIMVLGNTFCFGIGNYIKWWILSWFCVVPPILLSIFIFFIPDTPRHLLALDKVDEARKSMYWYTHGFTPEERERIFKRVKRGVDFLNENSNIAMKRSQRKEQQKRKQLRLSSRPVLHPLLVSLFLLFFQQSTGINVVGTFTTEILETGKDFVSVEAGTVIVGISFFIFVFLATLVVERWGRRPLLLGGSSTMFLSCISIGVYFYCYDYRGKTDKKLRDDLRASFSWIPLVCCNIFIGAYAMGLGSITWIVATEINHPDFQEIAGSLDSLTYWLTAFISTVTVPSLRNAIHYHWCFWLNGINCFFAFWYIYFFIYETKGKTQDEIMAHYKGTLYNPDDDFEGETDSIGSIRKKSSRGHHRHHDRDSRTAGEGDRRQSTGSDWDTDLETIFETQENDLAG